MCFGGVPCLANPTCSMHTQYHWISFASLRLYVLQKLINKLVACLKNSHIIPSYQIHTYICNKFLIIYTLCVGWSCIYSVVCMCSYVHITIVTIVTHIHKRVCVSMYIYIIFLLCYLSQAKKYLKGVKVVTPHTKMIHRIVGFSPCSCAEQT